MPSCGRKLFNHVLAHYIDKISLILEIFYPCDSSLGLSMGGCHFYLFPSILWTKTTYIPTGKPVLCCYYYTTVLSFFLLFIYDFGIMKSLLFVVFPLFSEGFYIYTISIFYLLLLLEILPYYSYKKITPLIITQKNSIGYIIKTLYHLLFSWFVPQHSHLNIWGF